MKASRGILIGVAAIAVVIAAALIVVLSSLDSIVKAAIEKYGSEVTQTDVRVSSVKIKLTSGQGAINGLGIGNPSGFSSPDAFSLGNISVKIDTGTVTEDVVVIDEILVAAPKITYEINSSGRANVNDLKKNIQRYGGGGLAKKSPADSKGDAEAVKLIIRRLIVEDGQVDVRVAALGDKPMSAKLPRIQLNDIGKGGGASPGEVAEKVLAAMVEKVGPAVANLGVQEYVGKGIEEIEDKVRQEVTEKAGGSLKDATEGAGEAARKLFGK